MKAGMVTELLAAAPKQVKVPEGLPMAEQSETPPAW